MFSQVDLMFSTCTQLKMLVHTADGQSWLEGPEQSVSLSSEMWPSFYMYDTQWLLVLGEIQQEYQQLL